MTERENLVIPSTVSKDEKFELSSDGLRVYLKQIGKVALLDAAKEVELAKDIEAGLYAGHLLEEMVKNDDKLPAAGRRDLISMERIGKRAKAQMIEANLRLVVSLAKGYRGRGLDFLDLIQEGNVGLMRAVELFDFTEGNKFSTYATWWINQAIGRAIANQARTIRIPVHKVEQVNKLARVKNELHQNLGRHATHEELAAELDSDVATIKRLEDYARGTVSLDMPVGENGEETLGSIVWVEEASIEKSVEFGAMSEVLDDYLMHHLTPREREVVRKSSGLHDGRIWSHDEIKSHLPNTSRNARYAGTGVTRQRVGEIHGKAMEKLRAGAQSDTSLEDFLQ